MVFKPVVPQPGYLPMQVPFFFFPYGTQPQLMASNEMTVPYTSLAVNYPNQCGATMYRPDYNGAMFPVNIAPSPNSNLIQSIPISGRGNVPTVAPSDSRTPQVVQTPYVPFVPQPSTMFSQYPTTSVQAQKPRQRFFQSSDLMYSFQPVSSPSSTQIAPKRPPPELSRPAPSKISRSEDATVIEMLCMLRMNKREPPVQTVSSSTPVTVTRGLSHAICPRCQKRIPLYSNDPPTVINCSSCNSTFPTVRRYLHEFVGSPDGDSNLELPCLRGVFDPVLRSARLVAYTNTVLSGRRCGYSTCLREVQKLVLTLVSKIDKVVTRELRHTEEECQQVMENLLTRVEQYCNGELHCRCLQPAYAQRHFIQCDVCDLWFHTSCVGVDSRKLASITSFVCPWCLSTEEKEEVSQPEETKVCVCPLCDRVFPRPCNLSRHLHAKHSMKWHTHVMLHMDVNDYLELDPKATHLPRGTVTHTICKGCYASEQATEEYEMNKSQFRYLLRKLRIKPSQWWIGKEVRVWDPQSEKMVLGTIKCIRPRSEFCIKLKNGSTTLVGNLFDPQYRVRLLILNGNFELELLNALPTKWIRNVQSDVRLYVKSSI